MISWTIGSGLGVPYIRQGCRAGAARSHGGHGQAGGRRPVGGFCKTAVRSWLGGSCAPPPLAKNSGYVADGEDAHVPEGDLRRLADDGTFRWPGADTNRERPVQRGVGRPKEIGCELNSISTGASTKSARF